MRAELRTRRRAVAEPRTDCAQQRGRGFFERAVRAQAQLQRLALIRCHDPLFARIEAEQGRLDLLVNNAFLLPDGLALGRAFWKTPISVWDDMLDVGTRSAYVATWHAARGMVERKAGLIVNVSSSGAIEHRWHVAYGVGKAALDRITADTAIELREHGVAVVSVWPGLVLTERSEAARARLPQLDFASAESQRFTGRAVVALAADPDVMARSERTGPG